ncbi:MAG: hypothetical protein DRI75_03555 [Bacteroidetes bacterium]|nr:MAG: hypothetical protein DRI75_03555 [Bacteroidota bacterium]
MNNTFKEHIIYKFCIVVLATALLTPSFVKFSHVFEEHIYEVCNNPQKTHFHEIDLDCEFYKFKLNKKFVFASIEFQFLNVVENYKSNSSQYQFLSDYQFLQFSLRGPPQLI